MKNPEEFANKHLTDDDYKYFFRLEEKYFIYTLIFFIPIVLYKILKIPFNFIKKILLICWNED